MWISNGRDYSARCPTTTLFFNSRQVRISRHLSLFRVIFTTWGKQAAKEEANGAGALLQARKNIKVPLCNHQLNIYLNVDIVRGIFWTYLAYNRRFVPGGQAVNLDTPSARKYPRALAHRHANRRARHSRHEMNQRHLDTALYTWQKSLRYCRTASFRW